MVFHAPTQLYVFMYYIIPYIFQDYSPWTIYYIKVIAWFIVLNMVANWFCVILYDPAFHKTKDNQFLPLQNWESLPEHFSERIQQSAGQNGHCVYDMAERSLPWTFCEKCQMQTPFRSHHCNVCNKCILKMDHHCYIVGNCIGFNNQRYFVVFTFYIMVNCMLAGYFTYEYIQGHIWTDLTSWTDTVLPLTVWRYIFSDMKGLNCLLILHLYTELIFGLLGILYFVIQTSLCISGMTLYEKSRPSTVRNTNTISTNMRSVFGDYWALNFLFPMTIIFPQRDNGIRWDGVKIDHRFCIKRKTYGHIPQKEDTSVRFERKR